MTDIAPIKRAATVVLLRDSPRGPEVFMVRRTLTIAFMAGAHVFPGGRVDDGDRPDHSWCDFPADAAAMRHPDLSFGVSAARELFEEAAVLLARDGTGQILTADGLDTMQQISSMRESVHSKKQSFQMALTSHGLRLALDQMVPFARWVTPPNEVRRFDTWFFLARLPEGQAAMHDEHESVASGWMTPSAALAACVTGTINLPPPTWATLRELETFATVADATAWASTRTIVERAPLLIDDGQTKQILMPGHATHPSSESVVFESRFVWTGERWLPEQQRT